MSLHAHEVDRAWEKLGMVIKNTNDRHALFFHDEKLILTTKRSFGSGPIEGVVQHLIRQQLYLSPIEFKELIACPLKREGFIEILKTKRKI